MKEKVLKFKHIIMNVKEFKFKFIELVGELESTQGSVVKKITLRNKNELYELSRNSCNVSYIEVIFK